MPVLVLAFAGTGAPCLCRQSFDATLLTFGSTQCLSTSCATAAEYSVLLKPLFRTGLEEARPELHGVRACTYLLVSMRRQ